MRQREQNGTHAHLYDEDTGRVDGCVWCRQFRLLFSVVVLGLSWHLHQHRTVPDETHDEEVALDGGLPPAHDLGSKQWLGGVGGVGGYGDSRHFKDQIKA